MCRRLSSSSSSSVYTWRRETSTLIETVSPGSTSRAATVKKSLGTLSPAAPSRCFISSRHSSSVCDHRPLVISPWAWVEVVGVVSVVVEVEVVAAEEVVVVGDAQISEASENCAEFAPNCAELRGVAPAAR